MLPREQKYSIKSNSDNWHRIIEVSEFKAAQKVFLFVQYLGLAF